MSEKDVEDIVWTNLAEIVRANGQGADRVANLGVSDGKLIISEACDEWFAIELDTDQVGALVDWLDSARQMAKYAPESEGQA